MGTTHTDGEWRRGDSFKVNQLQVRELATRPPKFLQEHELIERMDEAKIGTDASMSGHVANVIDRGYVVVTDETGQPLRPFRPGSKRPRQIGRYLVPTPLGIGLIDM